MNPKGQQKSESQLMWEAIRSIEGNITEIVNHVNKWVAKIQGIDSVAFAALLLHEGKEFKLDDAAVTQNQEAIQKVLAEMTRYRKEAQERAEAEKNEATAKSMGDLPTAKGGKKTPKSAEGKDAGRDNSTEG